MPTPKKLMLLVNPYSGRGLSKSALGDIVSRFAEGNYIVTVHITKDRNTALLVREHSAEFDLIVCVGGDGTLSDVVSGLILMGSDSPPPIGYIPMGTANDMATTLALSRDIPTAVQTILDGRPVPLDIGCFAGGFFTYIAAFGAFTGVSYGTPQNAKRALGHLAYVFGGLADIATIKPRHAVVEHDGGVIEDTLIFGGVTNSTSVAGLVKLRPDDVDLSDGKFEVILVRNPVKPQDFVDILTSVTNHTYVSDNVRLLHTSRVKFTFDDPVPWTRDGEDGGAHSEILIENRTRAVRIIIERPATEDAPWL
ncbi:MAG: YegS/Rv2252/BmrU family lipid kinase [Oscillospiraceae bacterium]|jgi:YegS/Rv2252/BmrU family lipid kinase|nr:YegS/Rv2252/BmrU family lipid kinase [Oscillospiraceae bacterium]